MTLAANIYAATVRIVDVVLAKTLRLRPIGAGSNDVAYSPRSFVP